VGAGRLIPLLVVAALASGCRDDAPAGTEEHSVEWNAGSAVVERVNDGDTITLRGGEKVRLVQIDAPELTTDCFGRAASKSLAALVAAGTSVTLTRDPRLDDRDSYGRILRYVLVRGANVNVALVRRGAASPYFFRRQRGMYAVELERAVREARAARRGYWGACPRAELNTRIGAITGPA
jgi:micrococcal nuclease